MQKQMYNVYNLLWGQEGPFVYPFTANVVQAQNGTLLAYKIPIPWLGYKLEDWGHLDFLLEREEPWFTKVDCGRDTVLLYEANKLIVLPKYERIYDRLVGVLSRKHV